MNNIEYYHLFFQIIIYYYCIYIIIYLGLSNDYIINFVKDKILNLKRPNTKKDKLYDIRINHKYKNIIKIISLFVMILCIVYLLIKHLLKELMKKNNCIIDDDILNEINSISDNKIIFNKENNSALYKKNITNKNDYIEYLKKKCSSNDSCDKCINSNLSLEDKINNLDNSSNNNQYYYCNFMNNKKKYKYFKTLSPEQQPNCNINENEDNEDNNEDNNKSYLIANLIFFVIILICINFFLINLGNESKYIFKIKLIFFIILCFICVSNLIYNLYKSNNVKGFTKWLPGIIDLLLIIFLFFYDKYCLTTFVRMVLKILN